METLIASLLSLLMGAALLVLVQGTYSSRSVITGENNVNAGAREVMDLLADHIRNAQLYNNGSNYVVFSAASSNSLTCYTNTTGDTIRYWLDTSASPYVLKQTQTVGGVATTTTILSGVQSLTYTYYVDNGTNYTAATSSWATTTIPSNPLSTEIPNVSAVSITATVTVNGYSRQLSTFIRLRNSPNKNRG
jgi:hypothetical protein